MGSGKKKGREKAEKVSGRSIKHAAKEFVDEAEKTGAELVTEVKELFDDLANKVADLSGTAAQTTVSMAERVAIKEPAELARSLLADVREASEASLRTIGKGFDELRDRVLSASDASVSTKTKDKKATKKSKAAAKSKTAGKKASKKTAARKKAAAKSGT